MNTRILFNGGLVAFDSQKIAFGTYTPCDPCHDSGDTPQQFLVAIAGVANGFCTNCSLFNAEFILESECALNSCAWRYDFPDAPCPLYHTPELIYAERIDNEYGDFFAVYISVGVGNQFVFRLDDPPNCSTWDNLNIPRRVNNDMCDSTAATCHVTAL